MKLVSGLVGLVMVLGCAGEARAQVLLVPVAFNGLVVGPSRSLSFGASRRYVVVSGYLPRTSYYYGLPTSRVTIRSYVPRPVVLAPLPDELAGVDLDVVKPAKKTAPDAEKVMPDAPEAPLPGVDVSVPRPPVRPGEAEPARKPKPADPKPPAPPVPPKEEPVDEGARLVQLGIAAFEDQEHGLAALRFQQAVAADPVSAPGQFLLGQALFALGKYREAVAAIQAGMRLKADWPLAPFLPRLDLYRGHEADLDAHRKRLENVVGEQANNATFLFLLAYELWFDGRRAEALPLFRRARENTPDPTYIDPFLKAPG